MELSESIKNDNYFGKSSKFPIPGIPDGNFRDGRFPGIPEREFPVAPRGIGPAGGRECNPGIRVPSSRAGRRTDS